jgi:hypothetical protein
MSSDIGNRLYMEETYYLECNKNAMKGCDKVKYLLPQMNRWGNAKKTALSGVAVGSGELEAKDSQGLGSLDDSRLLGSDGGESNVRSDSETSIILRISSSINNNKGQRGNVDEWVF